MVQAPDALEANDVRRMMPRFNADNIGHNMQIAKQLAELARAKGVTPAQLAIAWVLAKGDDILDDGATRLDFRVLAKGDDIVPIPGSRNEARVAENIAATEITLSATEIKALDALAPATGVKGDRYGAAMMGAIDR